MSKRRSRRIAPPCPITVAIEERCGRAVAYGVVTQISARGACIWTDTLLEPGTTLWFRISFAFPPEVHELVGRIVWARNGDGGSQRNDAICGVEWRATDPAGRARLRDLATLAAPPRERDHNLFGRLWIVDEGWPPA